LRFFLLKGKKILRSLILIILVVDKQLKLVGGGGNVLYKGVGFETSTAARSWH
jgi:hypothetical protein